MSIRSLMRDMLPEQISHLMKKFSIRELMRDYVHDYYAPYYVYRNGELESMHPFNDESLDSSLSELDKSSDRIVVLDKLGQLYFENGIGPRPTLPPTLQVLHQDLLVIGVNHGIFRGLHDIYLQATLIDPHDVAPQWFLITAKTLRNWDKADSDRFFRGQPPDLWETHNFLISEARQQDYLKGFMVRLV